MLFERTAPAQESAAASEELDALPNSVIPNSTLPSSALSGAGPEGAYQRATFSIGEREMQRLAVMELELRRQGKKATKSEIAALALQAALDDFDQQGMSSDIVTKLSGSLRRR